MRRLARLVLRHRRLVVGFWLLVLLAGVPNLERATNAFSQSFSVPGREGFQTNQQIQAQFGVDAGTDPLVPVVTLPAGHTAAGSRERLAATERELRAALPGALVAGYGSTGNDRFVARTVLRRHSIDSGRWHVTGYTALQNAGDSGGGTGILVEAIFGGLGALIVLAFVFASFLAFVPLVMALFAIVATFMLMWALTPVAEVSFIVTFLVALIGLGVCIDYALLLVVRWREERANGASNEQAVENAVATAGRRSCSPAPPSRSGCCPWSSCPSRSCAPSATPAC